MHGSSTRDGAGASGSGITTSGASMLDDTREPTRRAKISVSSSGYSPVNSANSYTSMHVCFS